MLLGPVLLALPRPAEAQRRDLSTVGVVPHQPADTMSVARQPLTCSQSMVRFTMFGVGAGAFLAVVMPRILPFTHPRNTAGEDAAVGALVGGSVYAVVGALAKPCGPLPYWFR